MPTAFRAALLLLVVLPLASCDLSPFGSGRGQRLGLIDGIAGTPRDTVVVLERLPCLLDCPVYEVAVYGDGTVVYNGVYDVDRKGVVRARVDRGVVRGLVAAFEAADYVALADALPCEFGIYDDLEVWTALRVGDRVTRAEHYHGCIPWEGQAQLRALEDEVDRALGTARWVGPPRY